MRNYKLLYELLLDKSEHNRVQIIHELFSNYHGYTSKNQMMLKKQDKTQMTKFIKGTKGYFTFDEIEKLFLNNVQLGMTLEESKESLFL